MDMLIDWLPRVGALFTVVLGLIGFFKPRLITDGQHIELGSPMAVSYTHLTLPTNREV